MPSDEIIETMARAIYNGRNGPGCTSWGRLPGRHKEPYISDARAALYAAETAGWVMVPKEPTEAMSVNGGLAIERSMFEDCDPLVFDGATKCYRAMLAAAGEPE